MCQHRKHFVQFLLHFHLAKPLVMEPPLMPVLEELPEKTQHILLYLCTYLKHLPKSLPKPQKGEIPKYPFGTFRIDRDLLEHTGDYIGAINKTFKWIFGWKTQTTGDGVLNITECGEKDIGAVADLLEGFLKQYPGSEGRPNAVLEKWAEDIANGCIKAILDAGNKLPDIPTTVTESYRKWKEHSQADSEDNYMTKKRAKITKKLHTVMPWLQPDQSQYPPHVVIHPMHLLYPLCTSPSTTMHLPKYHHAPPQVFLTYLPKRPSPRHAYKTLLTANPFKY
ncbi:hypothetical protein EV359DRAFT_68640 [Lentinula novae-zelandiae]|nr:hypothetical protein EV359DRAFT_68640 [Lentinula novae-zelandiae]